MKNKALKIFSSIEAMEAEHFRNATVQDRLEGLRQTVELILRVYGTSREELRQRPKAKTITIISKG